MTRIDAAAITTGSTTQVPEKVNVGDNLWITGIATIIGIQSELVDITKYGDDAPRFTLGGRTITVHINLNEIVLAGENAA